MQQLNRSRSIGETSLLFLALFLPGYLLQSTGVTAGPLASGAMLQSAIVGIPQFLLVALVAGARGPFSSPEWGLGPVRGRDAALAVGLAASTFAIALPLAALGALLPAPVGTPGMPRWSLQSVAQVPLALLFGIVAGYREEMYFRAYFLRRMEELDVPRAAGAAASTALFALGHLYEGAVAVVTAAAIGALYCAFYLWRRSVHVNAVAHGLYNAIVLAASLLGAAALPGAAAIRIFH